MHIYRGYLIENELLQTMNQRNQQKKEGKKIVCPPAASTTAL
jgi:hypothetical protein